MDVWAEVVDGGGVGGTRPVVMLQAGLGEFILLEAVVVFILATAILGRRSSGSNRMRRLRDRGRSRGDGGDCTVFK
jgi:hypothetical protein